jgi:4-amino-4-deoxy-L-arabinose transferase-like glycosyltransferase
LPAPPADRWDFAAGGTIFAIALAARLLYVRDLAAAGLISYLRLDPLYYHEWALRIAAGDWAGGSAVYEMSPLYAYFLAAVYRTFGEGQIVPRLIQSALGAAVCGLLVVVGRRAFGKVEGVIAGAAFALYAPAIFYDGQVMKTSFEISFTALMTFAFFMASARGRPPLPRWTFVGGVLLGLTALMRENILVAAPLFFVWAIWPRRPNPWRRCLPSGAALVAGAVLAILPATIRNLVVAREAVLITSLGGENFYTGNNETAGGRYTPPPFIRPDPQYEHEDFRQEAARRLGRSLTRREASNYWYGEGLRFITSHPVAFFRLLADKFAVFWNDFERPDNFSIYNFKRFSPLLGAPLLHFAWIAPAGILGIALSARRWRDLVPFHVVIAAYLASALIFFTQSRYRAPVVPILALFAAHAATAIVHAALARDARTLAWALPALAGLVLFVTIGPGNTPLFDAQNHSLVAEMELESGRLREAADEYRACIAAVDRLSESGSTPARRVQAGARLGLGRTLLKLGDVQGAVQELTRAAESPREDVRYASLTMLGVLLAEGGNARGSAEALKRAVAERPDEFEARMLYAEALDRIGSRSEAIAQIEAALRIRPGDVEAARIREALRRDTASR